jgi:16S rRNA (cytosine967-C5)-methyltransferase
VTNEPLDLPAGEHVQLWPHRHGTDAMFIQLLQVGPSA